MAFVRMLITLDGDLRDGLRAALGRRWLGEVWDDLCGPLRRTLEEHPLDGAEISEIVSAGRYWTLLPQIGRPMVTVADAARQWTWTPAVWADLLANAGDEMHLAGGVVAPYPPERAKGLPRSLRERGNPGWPRLRILYGWRDGRCTLEVAADEDMLLAEDGTAALALYGRFAELIDPAYGEVGFANGSIPTAPRVRIKAGWASYDPGSPREALFGHSWVTVLPAQLAERLGGPDALSATGAFHEVLPLPRGGALVRATVRLGDYDLAAARRVRDALAPVMPERFRRFVNADTVVDDSQPA